MTVSELHLLMDMFDGSSLDSTRPESLQALIHIACQVAQGLGVMHKMGYVHADIKPNNILVNSETQCKIIDFGQSCAIGTVKSRIQGTPDYIAPEQVALGPLTPATDIFNFGATLYWCVTDRHVPTVIPKKKTSVANVDSRTLIPPSELNPRIPAAFSRLILDCVENRPSNRPPNMDDVYHRLELVQSMTASILLGQNGPKPAETPETPESNADADTVT